MTKFDKLSDTGLDKFLRNILNFQKENTKETRRELIEATATDERFIDYVAEKIGFDGEIDLSLDRIEKMSERQFRAPSQQDEQFLAEAYSGCNCLYATQAEYWGSVTLALIKTGIIKSRFLAAQSNDTGKKTNEGSYRIDYALKKGDYDDLTRFILRSFTGHPKIRSTGVRDFYQHCPVSRAYWRNKLSIEAAFRNGVERKAIHKQLTDNKGIWAHLSEKGVSKLTVISDVNIFSGLTHYLVSQNITRQKECEKITAFLGAQTTWRALGCFKPAEISGIIGEFNGLAS